MKRGLWTAAVVSLLALAGGRAPVRAQPAQSEAVTALLRRLEQVVQAGDAQAYLRLLTDSADRTRAVDFASSELAPGATRVIIQERDRQPLAGTLPDNGHSLLVDAFAEFGGRARIATWAIDVKRVGDPGSDREWAIAGQDRISSVESLYRLSINPQKQFAARDLKLASEDLDLTLIDGSMFVVELDQGVTGLVLLGNGTMRFHPDPETERGQVKIFSGSETLESRFDAVYIRLHPSDYDRVVGSTNVRPVAVDQRELRRAQDVFRAESPKSFVLDLGDLSRDAWSLLPAPGDFLAEVRTKRFDTLTYAHSGSEAEDITLFDRKRHRNIAIYPSKARLAARGRFYNEDDLLDYDILDYDIEATVTPERQFIEGKAKLMLKARSYVLGTLTLKLADSLTVQSIVSREYGRLFGIRVKNQNSLVINLPTSIARDSLFSLTITYAGRVEPQAADREAVGFDQNRSQSEDFPLLMAPESSTLYSSRSFWYPQATVSDYATARVRVTLPAALDCVASGELEPGFPVLIPGKDASQNRKLFVFSATQPLRYLALIISRFTRAETATVAFPPAAPGDGNGVPLVGTTYRSLSLSVEANPRQVSRGRDLADRAADIATFYQSILDDSPYPSFTVALIENELPGGHSPGYFAALNQPMPTATALSWRNDPAAFAGFPDFFIAHELAHQWWGQAVGWRNYHEQWISEGFAQYFAALYAQRQRGDETFASVMRQCRRWGMEQSDQGPIYLGYRIGHIRGESRVFRAIVYNKSAAVLHMLRRLVGDDVFFRGVRRFYRSSRFHKAGTEEFRAAMEHESGRPLERFFERWIYGSTLPRVKFTHRVDGGDVVLRAEQIGELFDLPLTVTLQYSDKKPVDVIMPITEQATELRVPLAGTLRGVEVSKDDGTLVDVVKS
jgi:hypothetical protein